jgi:glucose/arabinose dehydrogenase
MTASPIRGIRAARALLLIVLLAWASTANAQLRAEIYVSGLTHPLGFIQDPSTPAVQYVLQQEGVIRVVRNGALEAAPFLNLSGSISTGGERGLLGLAFPPDYAASGRFYVDFTNPAGASVVARFRRSAANPLVADPASRFDLKWSNGLRTIPQPFANHNGGNLAFGPDGCLYIGKGDGGDANDPNHNAQNPASLLGKILRIDVNVPDADDEGFDIPADNPFRTGPAPEIWDFGVRNPWRFSFDTPALGGTGALVIGDVGQNAREEIDYEPAGRGGRNYGWRNKEGTLDNITTLPPAFLPLTDPIFQYDRTAGRSITGGYVYRGTALGAAFRGRYFFADFITGRVWSLALTIDAATGAATASDLRDHTADRGGAPLIASLSSFGVDAGGELYLANHSAGTILRIRPDVEQDGLVRLEVPANGVLRAPFAVSGWAIDPDAAGGTGIDQLQVWAVPFAGGSPIFLGTPSAGMNRPDVAAIYGAPFVTAGFGQLVPRLSPGRYYLVALGRVIATGAFAYDYADVTIQGGGYAIIETPVMNATVTRPFVLRGFALDGAAASGTGVNSVVVYAAPSAGGAVTFLGSATYGLAHPAVAAALGPSFQNSGFSFTVSTLAPGLWDIAVVARSTVTGTYSTYFVIRVTVQ